MAEEEDIMEDALTCGICSEEYQAGTREPVTLHCGHTFCRHCLLTLEKTGGLPCPACRKLHAAAQSPVFLPATLYSLSLTLTPLLPRLRSVLITRSRWGTGAGSVRDLHVVYASSRVIKMTTTPLYHQESSSKRRNNGCKRKPVSLVKC
nr:E3 ubiquitin-protein ligase rnf8-A-like [Cherax quadricarinatus]